MKSNLFAVGLFFVLGLSFSCPSKACDDHFLVESPWNELKREDILAQRETDVYPNGLETGTYRIQLRDDYADGEFETPEAHQRFTILRFRTNFEALAHEKDFDREWEFLDFDPEMPKLVLTIELKRSFTREELKEVFLNLPELRSFKRIAPPIID